MSARGVVIEHVAETGSTNSDLLARVHAEAQAGGADFVPCLLVTRRQTAGRGRHGRQWHAAEGASLTFSLAWHYAPNVDLGGLSLAVGLALAEALDPARPHRIGIKWPNDLWLLDALGGHDSPSAHAGRKLAGVLIETAPCGVGRVAVIGVGINVHALATADATSGLAALDEIDASATPERTLERVVAPLLGAVERFAADGFAPLAERYAERDLLRGRRVRFEAPSGVDGVAAGVAEDGALLVRTAGGVVPVRSGEARLLRPVVDSPAGPAAAMTTPAAAATTC